MDRNYKGGPIKFFNEFQTLYLDLEDALGGVQVPNDAEKIGRLEASIQDARFTSVKSTLSTMALSGNEGALTWTNCIASMIHHAEQLSPSKKTVSADSADAEPHENGRKRDDGPKNKNKWKTDLSECVPRHEWVKLSQDEQRRRREARTAKKQRQAAAAQAQPSAPSPDDASIPSQVVVGSKNSESQVEAIQ